MDNGSTGRRVLHAWVQLLVASLLVAACAGPEPSGPRDGSPALEASPLPSPSTISSTPPPTVEPTSDLEPTPEPTSDNSYPLRTEVQVNREIVDRPGVPADMSDLYWWTEYGDAGEIATTAQIGLPAGEEILTVADGLVVSARREGRGYYGRVDLLVRNLRSGELIRKLETDVGAPRAILVGRRLFWHGADPRTRTGELHIDGGVWTATVNGDDEPHAIIPGGENLDYLTSGGRSILEVSPSGRTLASDVGGFSSTFTDFIDTESLSVRGRIDGKASFALTDDTFATSDGPPSDTPDGRGLSGYDIATGDRLWRFPDPNEGGRFSMANIQPLGSGFAFQYSWLKRPDGEYRFESVEFRTGRSQWQFVQTETQDFGYRYATFPASSARHIAVIDDLASIGFMLRDGPASVSIYDTESGHFTENAFVVDPPWLCFENRCRNFEA